MTGEPMVPSPPQYSGASAPTLTDDGTATRAPLLDEARCDAIVAALWTRRSDWTRRSESFYTLGAAAYLDLCNASVERYQALAMLANPILRSIDDRLYA